MQFKHEGVFGHLIAKNRYLLAIKYLIMQFKMYRLLERRAYVRSRGMNEDASQVEIMRLLRDDRLAVKYLKAHKALAVKIQKVWS